MVARTGWAARLRDIGPGEHPGWTFCAQGPNSDGAGPAQPMLSAINDSIMAQLVVRQLDDELVLALKQRAARSGRSAEAEHREILRQALASELRRPSFKQFLLEMPAVGEDADFASPRDRPREPAL
jgi:plasmid stability protein